MTSATMVTPEAVALELQTANVGSRLVAFALDAAVVTLGDYVLLLVTFSVLVEPPAALPSWVVITTVTLLVLGWMFGYFIALETLWRGRTLGKAALGLRVVTREGGQVRFRHALIRAVLGIVDFGLSVGFVAVVSILVSRLHQRLGDVVAGTLVLRERSASHAPAAVTFAPPPGLEPYASVLDTSRLSAREYQAARSFLLRTPRLLPQARERLAVRLADHLAARVTPPPPVGIPAAGFLAAVAAAYQLRQRRHQPEPSAQPAPPEASPATARPEPQPQPAAWPPGPATATPPRSGPAGQEPPAAQEPPRRDEPGGPGPAEPQERPAPERPDQAERPSGGFAPPG